MAHYYRLAMGALLLSVTSVATYLLCTDAALAESSLLLMH